MIDTGNLLKDTITKSPEIRIDKNKLSNKIPKEILENSEKIINGKY